MSDIHQEWKDLRIMNGNFINHLDGEMAKLEKKQVELKRHEQLQGLADSGAFTMQFVAPPPFNCFQDDRDILKALNKAQADRIETLEKELIARKEQGQIDLAVKKDLDEKLDKATADYRALWVENRDLKSQLAGAKAQGEEKINNAANSYAKLAIERNNLAETISRMEKTIRDLDERNGTLRERLENTNVSLKKNIQETGNLRSTVNYLEGLKRYQEKEILKLKKENDILKHAVPSCNTYAQQGMQSKIAKQAAEIKRLTEENKKLLTSCEGMSDTIDRLCDQVNDKNADLHDIRGALDQAAKDAEVSFNRGRIKGMEEIWDELRDCYDGRPRGENEKIFGYCTVGEIVGNLSPTWFINRAEEYHEQEEKEEPVIFIGDEVEIFDSHDHSLSDIGIVTAIYFVMDENLLHFTVVGKNFGACFTEADIDAGNVKKTGKHFDSIPLDYFA